ncbi:hypothetical protein MKW92_050313 [Papaver armeniacum]|nr:hypothetical protein MKW92_050313 [Papaver armeniacum]
MSRGGGVGITNAANVGIAVQADWENREFNSNISINVRRLSSILGKRKWKEKHCNAKIRNVGSNLSLLASFFCYLGILVLEF